VHAAWMVTKTPMSVSRMLQPNNKTLART
jgi:hypothetical protein